MIFSGRINRAIYSVLLLGFFAIFATAVAFQFRIPGEVLLVFICVPRLHDLGRSGWWFGLVILVEAAVAAIGVLILNMPGISALATLAVLLVPAAILAFLPGQEGPNRFGDPPLRGLRRPRSVQRP